MRRMVVARRKMTGKKAGPKPGKERILNAAERLFARHGFYGISVRDITEEAGVDVALVSYHFGGKRELFTAVFQRRAELLNPERLAMLEGGRRAALPRVPTMEDIVKGCSARELYWGYQFWTGRLTLTFAETGRIDTLSGGLCRSSDLDSVHERLAPYVAAGFRALCDRADAGETIRAKPARAAAQRSARRR